jgi:hypothetical protein
MLTTTARMNLRRYENRPFPQIWSMPSSWFDDSILPQGGVSGNPEAVQVVGESLLGDLWVMSVVGGKKKRE